MSKRYELLMPASFDASVRVSRLSKNSLAAATAASLLWSRSRYARAPYLRGLGVWKVPLDQELRERRLRGCEPAAVLFEDVGARSAGAEALALGDDPPDLLAQRLDCLHLSHRTRGSVRKR